MSEVFCKITIVLRSAASTPRVLKMVNGDGCYTARDGDRVATLHTLGELRFVDFDGTAHTDVMSIENAPWTPEDDSKHGMKHSVGKLDILLMPFGFVRAMLRVLMHGEKKYGRENWKKVPREEYIKAIWRHWDAHQEGETIDADTGEHHLVCAACSCAFLFWLDMNTGRPAETRWTVAKGVADVKAYTMPEDPASSSVAAAMGVKVTEHRQGESLYMRAIRKDIEDVEDAKTLDLIKKTADALEAKAARRAPKTKRAAKPTKRSKR